MTSSEIKIISILKKKNKYIVSTINNDYTFDEDTIIKFSIYPNKIFSKDEFQQILENQEIISFYNKALNYMSYQLRSEFEVYYYLRQKDVNEQKINIILRKLKDLGYIDDQRYAKVIFDYISRQKKGPRVLELKLKQKGIKDEVIQEVVKEYNYLQQDKIINELIDKIKDKNKFDPVKMQRIKLYNSLVRYGFDFEIINDALNNVEFVDDSDEKLTLEIEKLIRKYNKYDSQIKKNKIISALMNKGYEYRKITKILGELE